jgi:hypothetical protein
VGASVTMNLSQRLDQARAMRQRGDARDAGPTSYDLRLQRDAQTYEGQNLKTGEEMTDDVWDTIHTSESSLPAWNPTRANDLVTIDLTVDVAPTPDADVIDLRSRQNVPEDDVFEMPAWARGEEIFRSSRE